MKHMNTSSLCAAAEQIAGTSERLRLTAIYSFKDAMCQTPTAATVEPRRRCKTTIPLPLVAAKGFGDSAHFDLSY